MHILVTGCAGFIGFHLTRKLLSLGYRVTGVDNLNTYYDPELKIARLHQLGVDAAGIPAYETRRDPSGAFLFIRADVHSTRLYEAFLDDARFDYVCHLAAQAGVRYSLENPGQYVDSNVTGFFRLLEYCRRHPAKRLVFAGSSSVYGTDNVPPYAEDDCTDAPVSLYAATKKSNELFAHCYASLYGLEIVGLRFFTVYGPWGRPDMAPFLFTRAILEDRPLQVFNNGEMLRDFTYIDDVIDALCLTLFHEPDTVDKKRYRVYNVGCSSPVVLNDFVGILERITGKVAHRIYRPMQPGDVRETWADITLLQAHYHYAPRIRIQEGLPAFVRWYRTYYRY
ncbi:MAG: NAD-dependent epimerase/dehydratase family protein [Culturomica sp.]|jgi:UDP-glucuronate 4-epimerase|nr:NAD-dependent epimerase/dehydratase family protein [Culturomica sp.]